MRILKNNLLNIFILLIIFGASNSNIINAQIAQEIKWLRVGSLHSWFSSFGAEIEVGRIAEQLDGLRWDAQFPYQNHQAAKGLWIGTTNYDDRFLKTTVPHKVIAVGTRSADAVTEIIPTEFKMEGRFNAPIVIVDGDIATENKLNDIVDEVNEDLPADRVITNSLNSYIGLSYTRKLMAFSQQDHDNYYIYDYTFKNTGIIDAEGNTDPKTLTDVYIFLQFRYGFGEEARLCACGWAPNQNIAWGRNAVNHQIGQDPTDPNFEMRAQYTWYGKHSLADYASLGCPYFDRDGRMDARQYVGTVTLHADKSPQDNTDDPNQPSTTVSIGSDTEQYGSNPFNTGAMTSKYLIMNKGHEIPTHAEKLGNDFADLYGNDGGGYSQGQGFGPYTIAPGDSIRIVVAEAVAGISKVKSNEVGLNWIKGLKGEINSFEMPDGSITSDPDTYKDAWVLSGEDSLLNTFRKALDNFSNGYNIPSPPPPPNVFEVQSGGDKITLTWADNAESWPNFKGYRVYRAIAKADTFYNLIYETSPDNIVNTYNDTEARRGFDYFYYVTSFDDGSTNNGVTLESSKFYTMTNKGAYLRKPAEEVLSAVRVVPNPFHIQARKLQFGVDAGDRIAFLGLPAECIIKIFTERGDLIETIHHNDGTGDELWDSRTLSEQILVSGLYIAYIEVTKDIYNEEDKLVLKKGESIFRKFIVIR
ncbi:MAG: hypothetical protein H6610_01015 [Ignavibacteriales bacterium]|nr:hypothetical protein [Ignavibacteriales bacterium]MCB9218021.1 hypothetical protein [Ignavibacteriales bacterium]